MTPPTFFLLFYMALTGQKEASFYDPIHNQSHYALVSRDDQYIWTSYIVLDRIDVGPGWQRWEKTTWSKDNCNPLADWRMNVERTWEWPDETGEGMQ